jgi:hypothetical protein
MAPHLPCWSRLSVSLVALGRYERRFWESSCPINRTGNAERAGMWGSRVEEEKAPALRCAFGSNGRGNLCTPAARGELPV